MTISALLQPPPGSGPVAVDETFPHPWSLRLDGWRSAWGAPAIGLTMATVDGERRLTGSLSPSRLRAWIRGLHERGLTAPATALQRALEAHLAPDPVLAWKSGRQSWRLDLSRPRIMGILNVTPDSFSEDGLGKNVEAAIAQGERMVAAGADILDIGGESTRPGAATVSVDEELDRVIPVITALAARVPVILSVDSSKAPVMRAALAAGAAMINDVTALEGAADDAFIDTLAKNEAPVVLMHKRGAPATMQDDPRYRDVLGEVYGYLAGRIDWCRRRGIAAHRLIIDPGIGFGKSHDHNLTLLRHLRLFRGLGPPILLGVSRKRLVGALTGETVAARRDVGSHVLAALGVLAGGARIVRVHDVAGAAQALAIADGWNHRFDPESKRDSSPDSSHHSKEAA